MGFFHWIGVFLLFAATILLLITTISAPVINEISLLKVNLNNGSTLEFGTFGYCILDALNANDHGAWCTPVEIGYSPAHVVAAIDHVSFHEITGGTSDALTDVMVLHPIACGLAFIAFLISCFAGMIGSLVGALIAFLAWILTLVSLAVDFTLFGVIHHHVNEYANGSPAHFASGIWCLLVAFVALFFGMIIVFFTCCSARREKRRGATGKHTNGYN